MSFYFQDLGWGALESKYGWSWDHWMSCFQLADCQSLDELRCGGGALNLTRSNFFPIYQPQSHYHVG